MDFFFIRLNLIDYRNVVFLHIGLVLVFSEGDEIGLGRREDEGRWLLAFIWHLCCLELDVLGDLNTEAPSSFDIGWTKLLDLFVIVQVLIHF